MRILARTRGFLMCPKGCTGSRVLRLSSPAFREGTRPHMHLASTRQRIAHFTANVGSFQVSSVIAEPAGGVSKVGVRVGFLLPDRTSK